MHFESAAAVKQTADYYVGSLLEPQQKVSWIDSVEEWRGREVGELASVRMLLRLKYKYPLKYKDSEGSRAHNCDAQNSSYLNINNMAVHLL